MKFILAWTAFLIFICWVLWHYFVWPPDEELDGDISGEDAEPSNDSRFEPDRKFYENNWRGQITKEKQESEKLTAIPNIPGSLENISSLKKEK